MSAFVRIEAAASPELLVDALRDTLAWLGDDELGPVFVAWVGELLMPLRFRTRTGDRLRNLRRA